MRVSWPWEDYRNPYRPASVPIQTNRYIDKRKTSMNISKLINTLHEYIYTHARARMCVCVCVHAIGINLRAVLFKSRSSGLGMVA